MDFDFTGQCILCFNSLSVTQGMVGDWKNHFSAEESARFDQKYRERMAGTGLEFEFE